MKKIKRHLLYRRTAVVLTAVMMLCGIAPQVQAGFVPSQPLVQTAANRQQDLQTIQSVLEQKLVSSRLESLGYTADEIQVRLSRMDDQEVHQLASSLDNLQSGGSAVGFVVGVLLIVLLIIVILKLADKEIIIT